MAGRFVWVAVTAILAGCVSTPAASAAPSAFAASAGCVGSFTWTFSVPLTRVAGSGTLTQSFDGVCWFGGVGGSVDPLSVGDLVVATEKTTTTTGTFAGTCDLALVTLGSYTFVLAQSSLAVAASPGAPLASVIAFTPDEQCDTTILTGTGTAAAGFTATEV